ncbi:alpha/beta fold hydrolase [Streptomyces indicus]|uniref:3-oxoadipate enol-lactonase n=1 Tax=Streptomyces indicus TaxID=417292 RepID=A0A1G8THZ3_9ACTN|nr:alpha/beta fold hydrolase [Streptomyces indicus]SDJ41216.1 3-oxoadipate enol-lactonase [Streptomyces indicus]
MSTLIFVHAFGSSGRAFAAQAAALGEEHRVHTPDLPGHGSSPGPLTLDRAVATVRDLLAQEDGPAYLVALSGGVSVALLAALDAPEKVAGLVLSGGAAHADGAGAAVQRRVLGLLPEGVLVRAMTSMYAGGRAELKEQAAEDLRRLGKRGFLAGLGELGRLDLRPRLAGIKVPALVLCGEKDRSNIPLAQELADGLPDAELRIVPGAGHIWNLEQPEQFTRTVREFIT